MVPVLASTSVANRAILGVPSAVITDDRARFARLLTAARVAFVWCQHGDDDADGFYTWLRLICGLNPLNEIICITTFDPDHARALAPVACGDVIWEHELPLLKTRLAELETPDPSLTLERFVVLSSSRSETCGRAIKRLCDFSQRPLRKVEKFLPYLGGRTEYERRAIWDRCFQDVSPKEVIDWVLLLRGLNLVAANGVGPIAVAVKLGIHERTLDRMSLRLADVTFAEARKPDGLTAVLVAFSKRLNPVLVPPQSAGAIGAIRANGENGANAPSALRPPEGVRP